MDGECRVNVEEKVSVDRIRLPSSRTNVALLVFTLFLVGSAAAVLLLNRNSKGPQQPDRNLEDLRHTLRQISNVRAAIHLEGEYSSELGTVQWQNNVDQSYFQGGLKLVNNEIEIPHSGLYFVYSQASYRVSCNTEKDNDTSSKKVVHLSHMVQRYSKSYSSDEDHQYRPILHSIRTACERTASDQPQQDGHWFSAVYTGAVFNLLKGDYLKTTMDQNMLPQLEDEPGRTFFGVFAL